MVGPTREMVQILRALNLLLDHRGPEDLVPPGEQAPMFVGCFFCGKQAHMPTLPHSCAGCGRVLRRVITLPSNTRGPYGFRLLRAYLWVLKELVVSAGLDNPWVRRLWWRRTALRPLGPRRLGV